MTNKRKGISPVIATVILVAVAVAIAIAVAFWAAGLAGAFTKFEKLEISSAYADSSTKLILNIKNSGSSDATISEIFLNDRPILQARPTGVVAPTTPISLKSGETMTINLTFFTALSSGVTYDVKIHTASGTDYPKAIVVP